MNQLAPHHAATLGIPLPSGMRLGDQPVEYIEEVGGIYFRAILLQNIGDAVPQHTHDYAHVTLIAAGKVRLWIEGAWVADIEAFKAIEIEAHRQHVFQALEPNTRLSCVHNLNGEPYKALGVAKLGG